MRVDICIKTLTSVSSQTLTEMETPRLALITLMCVFLFSQTRINGEEVELKVKAGENVTLYCDRSFNAGFFIVWIRNCSHENQPSLQIGYEIETDSPDWYLVEPFSFIHNSSSKSYDLHITNISASDLGLYYCGTINNTVKKDEKGIISRSTVYNFGSRRTHLSLEETSCSELTPLKVTPVSDCFFCWTLLFTVCAVCVLLFSICVYCLCQKKNTDAGTDHKDKQKGRKTAEDEDEELCYASVDLVTRRQNQRKTKRVQCSDFSMYAQVRTETEYS